MFNGILSTIYHKVSSYIWVGLLYNTFALKLFIDIGSYNILGPLLFFHFLFALLSSILFSVYLQTKPAIKASVIHSFLIWPSLFLIIFHGTVSFFQIAFYFLFLLSIFFMIGNIQFLFKSDTKYINLLFNFIFLFFLWGTNLIIESIPFIYDYFAPLSIAYHYLLVVEGIIHIGTVLYMITIVSVSFGLNYAKK